MAYEEAQDERAQTDHSTGYARDTGSITERSLASRKPGELERLDSIIGALDQEYEGLRAAIDPILDPAIDAPRPMEAQEQRSQSAFANRLDHLDDLVARLAVLRGYVRI